MDFASAGLSCYYKLSYTNLPHPLHNIHIPCPASLQSNIVLAHLVGRGFAIRTMTPLGDNDVQVIFLGSRPRMDEASVQIRLFSHSPQTKACRDQEQCAK